MTTGSSGRRWYRQYQRSETEMLRPIRVILSEENKYPIGQRHTVPLYPIEMTINSTKRGRSFSGYDDIRPRPLTATTLSRVEKVRRRGRIGKSTLLARVRRSLLKQYYHVSSTSCHPEIDYLIAREHYSVRISVIALLSKLFLDETSIVCLATCAGIVSARNRSCWSMTVIYSKQCRDLM